MPDERPTLVDPDIRPPEAVLEAARAIGRLMAQRMLDAQKGARA
jgi:hypothetical protein